MALRRWCVRIVNLGSVIARPNAPENKASDQPIGRGIAWAMKRTYPAVLEMAADLSHTLVDLTRLLAELDNGA